MHDKSALSAGGLWLCLGGEYIIPYMASLTKVQDHDNFIVVDQPIRVYSVMFQ